MPIFSGRESRKNSTRPDVVSLAEYELGKAVARRGVVPLGRFAVAAAVRQRSYTKSPSSFARKSCGTRNVPEMEAVKAFTLEVSACGGSRTGNFWGRGGRKPKLVFYEPVFAWDVDILQICCRGLCLSSPLKCAYGYTLFTTALCFRNPSVPYRPVLGYDTKVKKKKNKCLLYCYLLSKT